MTAASRLSTDGDIVTCRWQSGLREWWINNEQGVAQCFELAERPAIEADDRPGAECLGPAGADAVEALLGAGGAR